MANDAKPVEDNSARSHSCPHQRRNNSESSTCSGGKEEAREKEPLSGFNRCGILPLIH